MAEKPKRWHEHPILSGVIVAAIVYLCGWLFGPLLSPAAIAQALGDWAVQFGRWVATPRDLPTWVLLLWVLATLTLLLIVIAYRSAEKAQLRAQAEREDGFRSYLSDVFDGVRWRWRWANGRPGDVFNLAPFCRECDLQLIPYEQGFAAAPVTVIVCTDCGTTGHSFNGDQITLERNITMRIQREVRRRAEAAEVKPKPT